VCARATADAAYVEACAQTFELQWTQSIQNQYNTFDVPSCVGGTFNASWETSTGLHAVPQPFDYWGGRRIPLWLTTIMGLNGTLLFPVGTYEYEFNNGSAATLTCTSPDLNVAPPEGLPAPVCLLPLVLSSDAKSCVIPCPFPIYTSDVQQQIEWAFVAPAIVGLVLCVFTLCDSLLVIGASAPAGGFKLGLKTFFGTGSQDASSNNADSSGPRVQQQHRPRKQVRASTRYVLVGSLLGVLYFMLGPLPALLHWDQVSCSAPTIDIGNVAAGSQPPEPDACAAQRVAPFVLQALFNLILYAMVRVYWVMSRGIRQMSTRHRQAVEAVLVTYCVGLPLVTFIAAISLDKYSPLVFDAIVQLARQSTVCQYRLTRTQEWLLTFAPFISTGVGVTVVSARVAYALAVAKWQLATAGVIKARTAADVAMQQLILRLTMLGIITFIVLIIVIASTSLVTTELGTFAPAYETYVNCLISHISCVDCTQWKTIADARTPQPAVLSLQLASMSCIVLLFGLFFGIQSGTRLYREWKEQGFVGMVRRAGLGANANNAHASKSGLDDGGGTQIMGSAFDGDSSTSQVAPKA